MTASQTVSGGLVQLYHVVCLLFGCTDVDECASGLALCNGTSSSCTNTPGSYTCGCTDGGFKLAANNITCVGTCNWAMQLALQPGPGLVWHVV